MNDDAKNILLYGDSFFWGVNSSTGQRYKPSKRIATILQAELGDDYKVIEEGLRGRTMFGENGWFPERDGLAQFGPIFASQLPINVIVIMLGTNDLNTKTKHLPKDIAASLKQYKEKMAYWCDFMKYDTPKAIVVAPPEIDNASLDAFKDVFDGSAEQVGLLADELSKACNDLGYTCIDSRNFVQSKNADGIHISPDENAKLAVAIKESVQSLMA